MAKEFTTSTGSTITFDKKVINQDVYATEMKRGEFVQKSGIEMPGDPDQDGWAFLIREETTLRWSHCQTGKMIEVK